jgi:hypothetical protein
MCHQIDDGHPLSLFLFQLLSLGKILIMQIVAIELKMARFHDRGESLPLIFLAFRYFSTDDNLVLWTKAKGEFSILSAFPILDRNT